MILFSEGWCRNCGSQCDISATERFRDMQLTAHCHTVWLRDNDIPVDRVTFFTCERTSARFDPYGTLGFSHMPIRTSENKNNCGQQ
jgi:hypothetical protein